MKKIIYNSKLAHATLWANFTTITLTAFVFTIYESEKEMPQCVRNHECTHARQWTEMFLLSGLIIWLVSLFVEISPWIYLLAVFAFYLWYVIEWLVRLIINGKQAYKYISFEQEARAAQYDANYLENSNYFSWVKYYFRKNNV